MPPLVAFGRKWEIGSDDLVYPSLRNVFVRLPWLIITAVIVYQNGHNSQCEEDDFVKIYLFACLALLSMMILTDVTLIVNSSLGSIMETDKRRWVPLCIYIKLTLYLAEVAGNAWATWVYTEGKFTCTGAEYPTTVIFGLIICNWVMVLFLLIFWFRQFDPNGTIKKYEFGDDLIHFDIFDERKSPPKMLRSSQWERRLRCVFCCICGEGRTKEIRQIYPNASKRFAYMFTAPQSDLVQSDYMAAIMLQSFRTKTERKQEVKRKYGGHAGFKVSSSVNFDLRTNTLKLPTSNGWNSVPMILHYFDYAFAIFTVSAALTRRGKLAKSLFWKTQCCNCIPGRKKYPIKVVKDNFCYAKTASIRTVVKDQDLIYASYDNSDFCCPFFVATDHRTKTIVIAIRGSFSAVDFLVDCSVTPSPMNVKGLPQEFKAHLGFLTVAKTIKSRLDEMEVLHKLTQLYPDYMILTTGISLGAGVSTILSMMLQVVYPNVKCLAFAVPGAAVSLDAAEFCDDFVTSVIYGDDIVPRLGIPAFARCLTKLETALEHSKTPKYKIQMEIGCSIFNLRSFRAKFREDSTPSQESPNVIPRSTEMSDKATRSYNIKQLTRTMSTTSQAQLIQKDDTTCSPEQVRLQALEQYRHYPPGKVLHITETPAFTKRKRQENGDKPPKWEMQWVDRKEFNEIIFSKRMLLDHLPFRLAPALRFFSKIHNVQFCNDTLILK